MFQLSFCNRPSHTTPSTAETTAARAKGAARLCWGNQNQGCLVGWLGRAEATLSIVRHHQNSAAQSERTMRATGYRAVSKAPPLSPPPPLPATPPAASHPPRRKQRTLPVLPKGACD